MSLTRHNDESGLTTLEWLLIVAAVAGLAALAVVLVQNVVNDTAEQIAGSSARQTAATVAAQRVMSEARHPDQSHVASGNVAWLQWERYYTALCRRIGIIYSDIGVRATPHFKQPSTDKIEPKWAFKPEVIVEAINPSKTPDDPPSEQAIAHCHIQGAG